MMQEKAIHTFPGFVWTNSFLPSSTIPTACVGGVWGLRQAGVNTVSYRFRTFLGGH